MEKILKKNHISKISSQCVTFFILDSVNITSFIHCGLICNTPIVDGFYYVTSMLCGLPEPLTDVQPDSTEGKIMDIIIAIWSLAVAGTVIGVVGGMSLINVFIETAESAFEKKRKKSDDEEESEEPDAEEETKELGKRVSALEHAMRQKDDALKKFLAAVSR